MSQTEKQVIGIVLTDLEKRIGEKITPELIDELHEHLNEILNNSDLDDDGGEDEESEGLI